LGIINVECGVSFNTGSRGFVTKSNFLTKGIWGKKNTLKKLILHKIKLHCSFNLKVIEFNNISFHKKEKIGILDKTNGFYIDSTSSFRFSNTYKFYLKGLEVLILMRCQEV
jgi:hypothetical protein